MTTKDEDERQHMRQRSKRKSAFANRLFASSFLCGRESISEDGLTLVIVDPRFFEATAREILHWGILSLRGEAAHIFRVRRGAGGLNGGRLCNRCDWRS
jgi:hypothetical protein